jgi:PEP-CTERM/exosortase A-associated glycosyltransferase
MRILHILDHSIPLHSGYTFRTRNILRQQRKLGWDTAHVTGLKHVGAKALEEDVDDFHFYRTPEDKSLWSRLPVFNQLHVINTLAKRVVQVIDREKPDILHAHSPALNGMAALQAAKQRGLPVVYECRAFWEDAAVDHGTSTEWGARYRLTRALETKVFRRANAITTICEGLRGDIIHRGISAEKITVIPNAVDLEDFHSAAQVEDSLASSLSLDRKLVLGFIGSFYAYEGIPLLLEALPAIRREQPDVTLLLVGGGPEEERIRQKIVELNLQDVVVLTGRVPHSEVQRYYNLVDIFVYPRLSMRLTDLVTPLKPLEAMAQERLVIASDVGGHKELIENGITGHLFEANNVDSLVNTVSLLINQRDQWSQIRATARQFVERERSWEHSIARYKSVYGGLA